MQTLTLSAIQCNLEDVQASWSAVSAAVGEVNMAALDAAYAALVQSPDASSTPSHFQAIWSGLAQMSSLHALGSLRTRLDRECIMLTTFFAWRWLDTYCPQEIQEAWKDKKAERSPATWIRRLALDVMSVLQRRASGHRFHSATYDLEIGRAIFEYSNKRGHMYVTDGELFQGTVAVTTHIIASWLRFPLSGLSRYQAWFVYAIMRTVGCGALLLDEVWRGYSQLRKYVLGDSAAR
jgi:hypothetical protein